MTSITKTTQTNIDEFGRDLSLKQEKQVTSLFGEYTARFKGMSWAEITWLLEDEEEEERQREQYKVKQAESEELRKALAERKQLHQQGLYELEEGEELEM
jgi:DNA-binding transcriptional MerR regulator